MKSAIHCAFLVFGIALVSASGSAQVQAPAPAPAAGSAASGKEILPRKCFQCHQASMFAALRQDRRGWESTLYRMVGRGALWTPEEISAMAAFLAETRAPKAP
jgi:mono/diheme cytochrome c family protein